MNITPATNAMILVTNSCNLRCKYCYESKLDNKVIDFQIMKDAIDFILKNVEDNDLDITPIITFFGGEPLLHFNDIIKPAIEYAKSKNSRTMFSLTTNGTLIDEEILQYLKDNSVNFMLSTDGCKESQNANRVYENGEGTFDDINNKIQLILKYRPQTVARMTATPYNIKYLFDSLKYIENSGFNKFHLLPDVLSNWTDDDFKIAEEQFNLIKDYIITEFENENIPLVPEIICQMFTKRVIKEYEEQNNRYRQTPSSLPSERCGIGILGKVIIDTDGNLFSCPHCTLKATEEEIMYIGDIYNGIDEQRVETLLLMNEDKPLHSTLDCSECSLDRICSGGCTPNNYMINKDFNLLPDAYCKWNRIVYKTAEDIANYFDRDKTNNLFKDFFYGSVIRGIHCTC